MKILLEIKDEKAVHILEVLKSIPYVKAKLISDAKANLISDLKEAVEEMKQIHAGKKQAKNTEDFLNE